MFTDNGQDNGFSGELSTSLKIMNMFGYGEIDVSSRQICEWYNVTGNTASNRLNEMYHKRWLKRKRDPNPDVRNGYVYKLRKGGLNILAWMEENNLPRPCKYTEQYLLELAYKNKIKINWSYPNLD